MDRYLVIMASVLGLGFPEVGMGQVPGSQVAVEPVVDSVLVTGDTITVMFHVVVASSSAENLSLFFLDAPADLISASASPASDWLIAESYRDTTVAAFASLVQILPDSATGTLSVTAIGLPDLVNRYAVGWYPIIEAGTGDTIPEVPDPLSGGAEDGTFVGIGRMPPDSTVAGLVGRLQSLQESVCGGLGWGTSSPDCATFTTDLNAAASAVASSDWSAASSALVSFEASLASSRSSGNLHENGYWLLVVNSGMLRVRL